MNSNEHFRYLQKDSIKIKLIGIYIQDTINSNIKRSNNNNLKVAKKV